MERDITTRHRILQQMCSQEIRCWYIGIYTLYIEIDVQQMAREVRDMYISRYVYTSGQCTLYCTRYVAHRKRDVHMCVYSGEHCIVYCDRWVTAGHFYDTFAYEICFYGYTYFYGIYIYWIYCTYIYKALRFLSTYSLYCCKKYMKMQVYLKEKCIMWIKEFSMIICWYNEYFVKNLTFLVFWFFGFIY
jgi:hypothetical protein